jgi:hypothetical protein
MAETLTFQNQTEQTTMENLNADEQDSLQVGEAMVEAQDELLAGKYKDAEQLEKAYVELQKKLGDNDSEDEYEDEYEDEDVEDYEGDEDGEDYEEDEDGEDYEDDGILDELWEQANGDEYSEEILDRLSEMDAVDIADMHLRYREQMEQSQPQITEQQVSELKSVVGGEEQYGDMLQWAQETLNPQEVEMFDTVMERGDPLAAFFAIRSLAYRYEDSLGVDGKMVTGTAPRSDGSQFNSQAEVVEAMSDPRYDRDPAFRQKIMKKLERSDINF